MAGMMIVISCREDGLIRVTPQRQIEGRYGDRNRSRLYLAVFLVRLRNCRRSGEGLYHQRKIVLVIFAAWASQGGKALSTALSQDLGIRPVSAARHYLCRIENHTLGVVSS